MVRKFRLRSLLLIAVVVGLAVLVSAVVSLTLVPMMCAKLLRQHREEEMSAIARRSQQWFDAVVRGYGRMLDRVLDHQGVTLVVAVLTLVLTVVFYIAIPKGFFPVQDTGLIQGISEAPQSISFPAMAERQQALAKVVLEDPAVESLSSFIGVDGVNTTLNSGRMLINLKPHSTREDMATVTARLQQRAAAVEGVTLYLQPVQDLTIEDRVSRTQYQMTVESADPEALGRGDPPRDEVLGKTPRVLKTKEVGVPVRPGDVFFVESSGGGGYGPPAKRSPEARAADVANGFVSPRRRRR